MRFFLLFFSLLLVSTAQLDIFKGSGISTSGENNPISNMFSSILNPDNESRRNRPLREEEDEDYEESDREYRRRMSE
ncbi:hypothetical protein PMAYCL1PPCAC_12641 [Pristionchus mayeri]|uniref:Uncharacterized protein n=1 Tax=Pristionchus mayeri TaxID=1317129 RepID=A0AAN4ZNZ9_9BILA|nr:hypothetical protein PMAYCL1PPCAC_12641 [Pristionchus mayeri]